jgi:hypothetical protein
VDGNRYCVLFVTLTRIEDVYVVSLGGGDAEKSVLRDAQGNTHNLGGYTETGIEYLGNSLASPSWLIQGGTATLLFQIPDDAEPKTLLFRYYFKTDLEDESAKMGEIEVSLGTR